MEITVWGELRVKLVCSPHYQQLYVVRLIDKLANWADCVS